jgi:hypothetical protein
MMHLYYEYGNLNMLIWSDLQNKLKNYDWFKAYMHLVCVYIRAHCVNEIRWDSLEPVGLWILIRSGHIKHKEHTASGKAVRTDKRKYVSRSLSSKFSNVFWGCEEWEINLILFMSCNNALKCKHCTTCCNYFYNISMLQKYMYILFRRSSWRLF